MAKASRPQPASDAVSQIASLYYHATQASIARDLARAITLLKGMSTEAEREQAAVFMDGLSQMRSEWATANRPPTTPRASSKATSASRSRRR